MSPNFTDLRNINATLHICIIFLLPISTWLLPGKKQCWEITVCSPGISSPPLIQINLILQQLGYSKAFSFKEKNSDKTPNILLFLNSYIIFIVFENLWFPWLYFLVEHASVQFTKWFSIDWLPEIAMQEPLQRRNSLNILRANSNAVSKLRINGELVLLTFYFQAQSQIRTTCILLRKKCSINPILGIVKQMYI